VTPALRRLVDAMAAFYQLPRFDYAGETYTPGELLEAIVLTESSGNPQARRYEPHQDKAGRADAAQDADAAGVDNGPREDDASYGLTQVMGYNWRRLIGAPAGTSLDFTVLYEPPLALWSGIRILRGELDALYREDPHQPDSARLCRALARYNGGPTGDDLVDGQMRLQAYVARIGASAARARADRRASGWRETV
jgi:hypothetical protein